MKINKKFAFTLVETLITLAIVGIIAAITVPTLIQRYTEHVTVVNLKKHYNILQEGFKNAIAKNGNPEEWRTRGIGWKGDGTYESGGVDDFLEAYGSGLPVEINCHSRGVECMKGFVRGGKATPAQYLNGTSLDDLYYGESRGRMLLKTGAVCVFWGHYLCTDRAGAVKNICGYVRVYLDGNNKPAVMGKNTFQFYITREGVVPAGLDGDTANPPSTCKKDSMGIGCAAHVIYKGNMDYLH